MIVEVLPVTGYALRVRATFLRRSNEFARNTELATRNIST
jgi:hypothetical protein